MDFFDTYEEAQNAVEQLTSKGFSHSNVDLSSNNDASLSTSDTANDNTGQQKENGVSRFFKSLFGNDDDEADRYSKVGSRMGAIVTIHAQSDDEAEKAADLLDDYGAVDVNEKAGEYGYGSTDSMTATPRGITDSALTDISLNDTVATGSAYNTTEAAGTTNQEGVIPVIQEDLEVGKRTVQTGGVRVRSRIVQRPVEESIRLREEKVTVERTPVNRVLTGDDLANFQEQNIELVETAEVPVVNKQARVVEEVRVGKDATERDETIRDTVRNTEVDVENLEGDNTSRTQDYTTTANNSGL